MRIIIDHRMRDIEKEYLKKIGELIEIPYQDCVYDEISSHPDVFLCKIDDKIFRAPNLELDGIKNCIIGKSKIQRSYPQDISYNIAQIGKNIIHNFKFTDNSILEYINKYQFSQINVKQGYSKCSICVTSDISCITSDLGIYKSLKESGIDVLYVNNKNIGLVDKNGSKTKMKGFIGGAMAVIGDELLLFGDIDFLEEKYLIIEHLKKYNLKLVEFKNIKIIDYGGIIIL